MNPLKITKAHKEKKWREAIKLLDDIVCIKLAPSSIHGIGVFATRNLKKGDKIYADVIPHAFDVPYKLFRRMKPVVADTLLNYWPNIINGAHFLYPITKSTAYLNHSNEPNYNQVKDEMLKDVNCGEEITVDYKLYPNWEKLFKWLK